MYKFKIHNIKTNTKQTYNYVAKQNVYRSMQLYVEISHIYEKKMLLYPKTQFTLLLNYILKYQNQENTTHSLT